METEKNYTQITTEFLSALRSANPDSPLSVILIGSAARGTERPESDLDLLVLAPTSVDFPRTFYRLHVQSMSEDAFLEKLRGGDDFAAWCVRFGVPLIPSAWWLEIANSPAASEWPDWRNKVVHAARRLLLAGGLLETGDQGAALEETLYAVSHAARAVLLRERVFPLSRPEMVVQLYDAKHKALADVLKALLYGGATERDLRRGQSYVKKLLVRLDRHGYRAHVDARRQALRRKRTDARRSVERDRTA